jgi:hypothetical protein
MRFAHAQAVNSLWAIAKLRMRSSWAVVPLAQAVARNAPSFTSPIEAASAFWAFAKLDIYDDSVLRPVTEAVVRLLPQFSTLGVSNAFWAAGTLGFCDAGNSS